MRFLSRFIGSFPEGSRARHKRHATGRRRSPVGCEMLEARALLSNIPGVSLQFGNLAITATKASGNVAVVSIDPSNHNVKVSFNGQSEEFKASLVDNITYTGGKNGGDTFTDNTNLVSLEYGYGGSNNFTGGTSYNYVYFWGNSNNFDGPAGSVSDVFEHGGKNDTTEDPPGAIIYVYPNS